MIARRDAGSVRGMNGTAPPRRPLLWKVVHGFIIANFVIEIIYAQHMVFSVLRPPGAGWGPLGARALTMDPQQLIIRRMYASEAWVAIAGLCVYLAITEMYPRFWRAQP